MNLSGKITDQLYRDPSEPVVKMAKTEGFPMTGREIVLNPPQASAATVPILHMPE